MPLKFDTVTPEPVLAEVAEIAARTAANILAAPSSPTVVDLIQGARPVAPTPVDVMPPIAGAGVELAKWVLLILAGSIVLLVGYLLIMESKIGSDVRTAYNKVQSIQRVGAE